MAEQSIVRENLMTEPGYVPYCGANNCDYNYPRTIWDNNKKQFTCGFGWVSQFPDEFMDRYIKKWEK